MTERYLPYGRQAVDDNDIARVVEALRSDFLTTGPLVEAFERRLSEAGGVAHAVAVSSGSAALHTACFAAGIGAGDEVITSPLTFVATANAALQLGAAVRFVDVEARSGLIDPSRLAQAIGPRTKLVIAVDYAGLPADYDALLPISHAHGVKVVADAAHSFGASLGGRPVGSLADVTTLSFHPVKSMTAAEGGAVLTSDARLAGAARVFRNHGVLRDREAMEAWEGPWCHEMQHLGMNYRLSDVHCALGLGQIEKLGDFIERREAIARRYDEALSELSALELPAGRDGARSAWHLYVVRVNDPSRRRPLFDRLRELGLGVQVHYLPVHLQPFYRRMGFAPGMFPNAEDFYARCLSLPIFPSMSDDDVTSSIERVRRAVRELC